MKILICLEKYSDYLEAYSVIKHFKQCDNLIIIYIENERNNELSVKQIFNDLSPSSLISYISCNNRDSFFDAIRENIDSLNMNDIVAAPFIRYKNIWLNIRKLRKKRITTIHLSETFPDSFGIIGYRFGYRINKFSIIEIVRVILFILYSLFNKPDICFYNLYPKVKNPFVKKTIKAEIPKLNYKKRDLIYKLLGNEKRVLIVSGFEYDLNKIVKYFNLKKYVATSKNKEIIVDGTVIPLDEFVCAEEVLLSGLVNEIISYNSTSIAWAMLIGNIKIQCFESYKINKQYGFMYGRLNRRTLSKCKVTLHKQNINMVV